MPKSASEIAIELRAKFEFYLLALTFGILGLSIQTADFGDHLVADAFELTGWLALFVSGITGILRTQWVSVVYEIQSKRQTIEHQRAQVLTALEHNIEMPVTVESDGREVTLVGEAALQAHDEVITELERQFRRNDDRINRRYRVIMWAFMLGIGCLLVARGLQPALSIIGRLNG